MPIKIKSANKFAAALLLFSFFLTQFCFNQYSFAGIESLPVQDDGRIKPFDTFSREALSLLHGKETMNGKPAYEVVFSWILFPEQWANTEFLLVRHSGLREAMKLDNKRLYFKPIEIMQNDRLTLLFQELKNKQDVQEKLNPFYQAVLTLENQLSLFRAIGMGVAINVWPSDESNKKWMNLTELDPIQRDKFKLITSAFMKYAAAAGENKSDEAKKYKKEFNQAADAFVASAREKFGDYANDRKIQVEEVYNKLQPFRWSWVLYFTALIFFSFAYFGNRSGWGTIGWTFLGLGFLFHTFGFACRVYIQGRPPVSNMFETVIWVAWGALVMSVILYRFNRAKILPLAASMVATLCLILCDVSSSVLDSTMSPLVPVLRDNFWLMTHVVIIVSSYAAFFLAFFIGDILLFYYLKDEARYHEQIKQGAMSIYRAMQIGIILLAAGVILGGIWADYSWGRFWGWDPKETWAFIALLGYLVVLHGRIIGWLKNFGLTVSAVVSFSLVIMSWYGVNFVLGAGLHTYGFGAGGVEYVAAFVAAHLLFVIYVITLRQNRLKATKT